jgi:Bacterial TSP3 repeat
MSTEFVRRATTVISAPLIVGSVLFAAPAVAAPIDTDGDGSADVFEKMIGTSPNDPNAYAVDADKDGYPNFYEMDQGTDPDDPNDHPAEFPKDDSANNPGSQRLDTDGDGLFDDDEADVYGTDPRDADSDNDGASDGDEVFNETDPLTADDQTRADSDGDGLFDVDETKLYGTNPSEADTDGDGVIDGAEDDNGTDPNDPADS